MADEADGEREPKTVKVPFPVVLDTKEGKRQAVEFTASPDLDTLSFAGGGGPPGSPVRLTFRISQWEEPFSIEGKVAADSGPGTEAVAGRFTVRLEAAAPRDRTRLERLVEGHHDGSVVEAIRRTVLQSDRNLTQELRRRPVGQKMIFALFAQGVEIRALIRDGQARVAVRLLDNPRLAIPDVREILRRPSMTAEVMLAIRREPRWMADDEIRVLLCSHPATPLPEALAVLRLVPRPALAAIEANPDLRPQIRILAARLQKKKPAGG